MGFNLFGRRRRTTRRRTTRRKMGKKPSAVLVKLCKRYGVKLKSGKSYKSTRVLKKQCGKRIRALIRKVKSQKRTKKSVRSRRSRRSRFGLKGDRRSTKRRGVKKSVRSPMPASMPVKRRTMLQRLRGGVSSGARGIYRNKGRIAGGAAALYAASLLGRTAKNRYMRPIPGGPGFLGEARNVLGRDAGRVKHAPGAAYRGAMAGGRAAYNAPSAAYKRVMGKSAFGKRRRRYGFGNGGNPPLNASMGYEFCSNGGGVLGADSTGLFPSPCTGGAMAPGALSGTPPTNLDAKAEYNARNALYTPRATVFRNVAGPVSPAFKTSMTFGKRRRRRM